MDVLAEIKEVFNSDTLLYAEVVERKDVVRYEEEDTSVVGSKKLTEPTTRHVLGEVFSYLTEGMREEELGVFGVDFNRIYTTFKDKEIYIVTTLLADNKIALFVRFI